MEWVCLEHVFMTNGQAVRYKRGRFRGNAEAPSFESVVQAYSFLEGSFFFAGFAFLERRVARSLTAFFLPLVSTGSSPK